MLKNEAVQKVPESLFQNLFVKQIKLAHALYMYSSQIAIVQVTKLITFSLKEQYPLDLELN